VTRDRLVGILIRTNITSSTTFWFIYWVGLHISTVGHH